MLRILVDTTVMEFERPLSSWTPGEEPATSPEIYAYVADLDRWVLPRDRWNHAGHLVTGLVYLDRLPLPEALRRLRSAISGYNVATGTPNTATSGYHETLTRWYLGEIDAWRRSAPAGDLAQRVEALLASPLADAEAPLRSYRPETLHSPEARRTWVTPDRDLALQAS
jgi:sugar/nucleoside kinase (ribokinase family)